MSVYKVTTATPCNSPFFTQYIEAIPVLAGNCTTYVDKNCTAGFSFSYSCMSNLSQISFPNPRYTKSCIFPNSSIPYYLKYTRLSSSCELSESYEYLKNSCSSTAITETYFSDNQCSQQLNQYVTNFSSVSDQLCTISCQTSSSLLNSPQFVIIVFFWFFLINR